MTTGKTDPAVADTTRRNSQALGANYEIGKKVKQYYDDLVSEQVPDRFAELLAKLDQAEPARNKD